MHAFVSSAGERVENKFAVEIWIQNPINGVMQKPVADAGLVNIARLWVVDFEGVIRPVPIDFISKFLMER